jgi:hypothetical protein
MAVHAGEFRGCAITVTTEEFRHELFGLRHRTVSVTVTREGRDLGYHPGSALEGRDEAELVELAAQGARTFIANRFPQ